ncbi:sulfotransferase 1C4-like isoform X1 [Mytilus galloprovincialis]|uniref:sulfotransferase 1C4-like isoform X1 n=1 Tax=Mytilus galloprovincialis TaxID=29158 RepID=UPI003F7CB70A
MDIPPEMMKAIEQMKSLPPVPWPEYEGIPYPAFLTFRMKGAEQLIQGIKNFQSRETDILICTHSKSGTHWLYEILALITSNKTEIAKETKGEKMFEAIPDLSILDALPSPRILDTHVQFQYIPTRHVEKGGKIVHMIRNPKDVSVSLHNHARKDICINLDIPWNEYFEIWMTGKLPYGSWFDYELGMEQAEKDHPGLIYTCYYEDMKKNPTKEIKKLADFLEINVTDETVEGIAKATTFDNMQKNKMDGSKFVSVDGQGFIYRKGEIGDWKNYYTVAQNERYEALFKEKMKDSQYKFQYE